MTYTEWIILEGLLGCGGVVINNIPKLPLVLARGSALGVMLPQGMRGNAWRHL